jgi:hypothetical protein
MVVAAASTAAVDPFVGRTGLTVARVKPWQTPRRLIQIQIQIQIQRNRFHNSGGAFRSAVAVGGEGRLDVVDSVVGSCGTELNACFDDAFCGLLFMVRSVIPVSPPFQELLKSIEDLDHTTGGEGGGGIFHA